MYHLKVVGGESGESAGNVCDLKSMLDKYCRAHDWNTKNGVPTRGKLKDLDLDFLIADLEERNIWR
ncbi:MAG: aldehyde ferredoxin oxidoreductase C-terminal domain-containing protein [Candidatus Acetothermia bacterium]